MNPSSHNPESQGVVGGMSKDFLRLAYCYFEGVLSSGELDVLQSAMQADPSGREAFVRLALTRTALLEKLRQQSQPADLMTLDLADSAASSSDESFAFRQGDAMILPAIAEVTDSEPATPVEALPPKIEKPSAIERALRMTRQLRWPWAAVIALPLLLGVAFYSWEHRSVPHATLTAIADEQWEDGGAAPHVGEQVPTGPLSLQRGLIEIHLDNGVRVIVEGPARFRIRSERVVDLSLGKMTVFVSAGAHGFAVQTPSARVVDLGTEFGVVVDAAGASETHVLRGTVECTPTQGGNPTRLAAGQAARVDADGGVVSEIQCRTGDFVVDVPAIDLVDVVAGGDGTQRQRNGGISAADGSVITGPPDGENGGRLDSQSRIVGDARFHPCPDRPLIAGIFVPHGGAVPDTIDPAGDRFTFPSTDNRSMYWLWAGGSISVPSEDIQSPTTIGNLNYNTPGHGVLLMHANKGVTFDLDAMRTLHPRAHFGRFRAICVNVGGQSINPLASALADLWVLVDGKLKFSRSPLLRSAPPFTIDVPVEASAHYLTLAVTDGGDGYKWDWVVLADPRLE